MDNQAVIKNNTKSVEANLANLIEYCEKLKVTMEVSKSYPISDRQKSKVAFVN